MCSDESSPCNKTVCRQNSKSIFDINFIKKILNMGMKSQTTIKLFITLKKQNKQKQMLRMVRLL